MTRLLVFTLLWVAQVSLAQQSNQNQQDAEDLWGTTTDSALSAEAWSDDSWDIGWGEEEQQVEFHGFVEGALGSRLSASNYSERQSLADLRLRIETSYLWNDIQFTAKGDLAYDGILNDWITQSRELSAQFSFAEHYDLKVGRQVLTWGTGDYVFLNDLFPKDWQSFFAGRHDEYLKAPSDAVKLSGFFDAVNIDIVWTPKFDHDVYLNGEYFSFFNPWAGGTIAPTPGFAADTPSGSEWAMRLFKSIDGTEYALYAYDGYQKSPKSLNDMYQPSFAELRSVGASIRTTLGSGLLNVEYSRHAIKSPNAATNPMLSNSQDLLLVGYQFELVTRLTAGFQFYLEHTKDHGSLISNSPFPDWETTQNRTLFTNRLMWRNAADDWTVSLFTFYSPSDQDAYLRPSVQWRKNDKWQFNAGMNLFHGEQKYTFFGQFEDNNNAWLRARYSF